MKKNIVKDPDPVLHQHALEVPVEEISSKKIQRILHEMRETLSSTQEGIGIAALQIGYRLRIFLASEEALRWEKAAAMPQEERKKKQWTYYTFINPVIKNASKKKMSDVEGCLSVPQKYGIVERAEKISVEAYDEYGIKFQRGASGLYARVMQHEIDHLNGILFIEKARNIKNMNYGQKRKTHDS